MTASALARDDLGMRFVFVALVGLTLGCRPVIIDRLPAAVPELAVESDGVRGPASLLVLGGTPGTRASSAFYVTNVGQQLLGVRGVTALEGSLSPFEVELPEGLELPPGETWRAPVTYSVGARGTSDTRTLELRFRVSGDEEVVQRFSLVGQALRSDCPLAADVDLGRHPVGLDAQGELVISNPASEPASVQLRFDDPREVFSFAPRVTVFELAPGATERIPVGFRSPSNGHYDATVRLLSPECADRVVRVHAEATLNGLEGSAGVHFGRMVPGTKRPATATLRNTLARPVRLRSVTATGDGFSLVGAPPLEVPAATLVRPGEWVSASVEVQVEAAPRSPGLHAGSLVVEADLPSNDRLELSLMVDATSEVIELTHRTALQFDQVAFFPGGLNRSIRELGVRNNGTTPLVLGVPTLEPLSAEAGRGELCFGEVNVATRVCELGELARVFTSGVAPGEAVSLPLTVVLNDPNTDSSGRKRWRLTMPTSDPALGTLVLEVSVRPASVPPCSWRLEPNPPAFDFGVVPAGAATVRSVRFCNLAPPSSSGDVCLIDSFRVVSGQRTFLLNRTTGGVLVGPGQCDELTALGRPAASGDFTGVVEFFVSSPFNPTIRVPLHVVAP